MTKFHPLIAIVMQAPFTILDLKMCTAIVRIVLLLLEREILTRHERVFRTFPLPQDEPSADDESQDEGRDDRRGVPWVFAASPGQAEH
jgi:hypothetical protein